jgi:hypothetical protein
MEFFRKYKFLAVGGTIALILLIVAGVFLFLNIQKYVTDIGEVEANQNRLAELENRKPAGPTGENVLITASNAVIKEACLHKLLLHLRQGQVEPRKDMQRVVFNSFLKTTIDQMNDAAKKQGMLVPLKFDYGFKTYYSEGKLPANNADVPRLTVQVQLVKALVDMIQQARVAEILVIERQVFEEGAVQTGAAGNPSSGRGEGRMAAPAASPTGGAPSAYPLEPPDAQGLYTREHFTLSLKASDERLAALLNILAHNLPQAQPRLFAVVTKLDITGTSLIKPAGVEPEGGAQTERVPGAVAVAPAEGTGATEAAAPEKPAPPKKRAERLVTGMDSITVQLDVDIYRFATETKEKGKP